MKKKATPKPVIAEPSEEEIRDYAYHLYLQRGQAPGRELDDWLEARSNLMANAAKQHVSPARARKHTVAPYQHPEAAPVPSLEARNMGA